MMITVVMTSRYSLSLILDIRRKSQKKWCMVGSQYSWTFERVVCKTRKWKKCTNCCQHSNNHHYLWNQRVLLDIGDYFESEFGSIDTRSHYWRDQKLCSDEVQLERSIDSDQWFK